jgi:hypothetical protein
MAAAIVTGFFENEEVKADLKAEFEAAARRPLSTEDSVRKPEEDESAAARRAAEAERRRRDAEHRRRTDNWDDGRGRH